MNINSINVNKYPISTLLNPEHLTVFEIPKYQREYVRGTSQLSQWIMWRFSTARGCGQIFRPNCHLD